MERPVRGGRPTGSIAEAERAQARAGDDEGAYLDALEDIYDKAGL